MFLLSPIGVFFEAVAAAVMVALVALIIVTSQPQPNQAAVDIARIQSQERIEMSAQRQETFRFVVGIGLATFAILATVAALIFGALKALKIIADRDVQVAQVTSKAPNRPLLRQPTSTLYSLPSGDEGVIDATDWWEVSDQNSGTELAVPPQGVRRPLLIPERTGRR